MRSRSLLFALTVFASVVPVVADAQAKRIDITGMVRDSETGKPISGAVISRVGSVFATHSDSAGAFKLSVADDDWPVTIRVAHAGHRQLTVIADSAPDLAPLRTVALLPSDATLWVGHAPTCEPLPSTVAPSDSTRRIDGLLEWQQVRPNKQTGRPERVLCHAPVSRR